MQSFHNGYKRTSQEVSRKSVALVSHITNMHLSQYPYRQYYLPWLHHTRYINISQVSINLIVYSSTVRNRTTKNILLNCPQDTLPWKRTVLMVLVTISLQTVNCLTCTIITAGWLLIMSPRFSQHSWDMANTPRSVTSVAVLSGFLLKDNSEYNI